jgi:O-antigen/teichoic acid export membrane protein
VNTMERREATEADVLGSSAAGELVIRGSAVRVSGYAVNVALGVLAAAFLIRHLGVADYGTFVAVTSLVTVVAAISDAGLGTIALREYAARPVAERDAFLRNLLGIRLLLTIFGIGAIAAVLAVAQDEGLPALGFTLVGIGLVLTVAQHNWAVPLAAQLRVGTVTALELVRSIGMAGLVLAFVAAGLGLNAFFATPIPVGIVVLVLTALIIRGSVPLAAGFQLRGVWSLLRDALAFTAASTLGVAYYRIAIVLLSVIATQEETGYFGASVRVIDTLTVVPVLLVSTAFPVLSRAAGEDAERFRYATHRLFDISLIVGVWFALSTAIAAAPAIELIAGSEFSPSIPVLQIQSASLLATFLAGASGYALLALRRHAALLVVNALALALAVTLTLILAPSHGAKGAAIAMTVSEFVLVALQIAALMRYRRELRPQLTFVPRVALAAAAAASIAFVPGLPALAALAVSTLVFFALLFVLRGVPPEVLDALRNRIGADRVRD